MTLWTPGDVAVSSLVVFLFKKAIDETPEFVRRHRERRVLRKELRCIYSDHRYPAMTREVAGWVKKKVRSVKGRSDPRFAELQITLAAFSKGIGEPPEDTAGSIDFLNAQYDAVRANGHAPSHAELLDVLNRCYWPKWLPRKTEQRELPHAARWARRLRPWHRESRSPKVEAAP